MSDPNQTRRRLLVAAPTILIGGISAQTVFAKGDDDEKSVTATEDLMREHGVLRRILLVYREAAQRIAQNPGSVDPKPLYQAAQLFTYFGEQYHEKAVEEPLVFPVVRKAGGPAAAYVDTLIKQHDRGRDVTGYILSVLRKGKVQIGDAPSLTGALNAMDLMYENHTAREDTVVFPAFKAALSPTQYQDMSEKFEDIEHKLVSRPDYEAALKQITAIEQTLGFADLAQFTAPQPPKL